MRVADLVWITTQAVSLKDSTGSVIATTQTKSDGTYSFSSRDSDSLFANLLPNKAYSVVADRTQPTLNSLQETLANVGVDTLDSDGVRATATDTVASGVTVNYGGAPLVLDFGCVARALLRLFASSKLTLARRAASCPSCASATLSGTISTPTAIRTAASRVSTASSVRTLSVACACAPTRQRRCAVRLVRASDNVELATTVTASASGQPGYYLFSGRDIATLLPGVSYRVVINGVQVASVARRRCASLLTIGQRTDGVALQSLRHYEAAQADSDAGRRCDERLSSASTRCLRFSPGNTLLDSNGVSTPIVGATSSLTRRPSSFADHRKQATPTRPTRLRRSLRRATRRVPTSRSTLAGSHRCSLNLFARKLKHDAQDRSAVCAAHHRRLRLDRCAPGLCVAFDRLTSACRCEQRRHSAVDGVESLRATDSGRRRRAALRHARCRRCDDGHRRQRPLLV